jgi:hypothetical protein
MLEGIIDVCEAFSGILSRQLITTKQRDHYKAKGLNRKERCLLPSIIPQCFNDSIRGTDSDIDVFKNSNELPPVQAVI